MIAVVCVTAGLVSDPKEDASGAASSAPAVMVDGTVYRLGPNGKTDALPADCEVIGLIKKLASSETPSEDFAAAGLEIGWKVYRGADTGTVYVLDETDGLYYPLDSFDVEAAGKEAMLFTSGDTDLLEIGRAAFEHYYSAFMGENIPEKYRITSFEMTDILLVRATKRNSASESRMIIPPPDCTFSARTAASSRTARAGTARIQSSSSGSRASVTALIRSSASAPAAGSRVSSLRPASRNGSRSANWSRTSAAR